MRRVLRERCSMHFSISLGVFVGTLFAFASNAVGNAARGCCVGRHIRIGMAPYSEPPWFEMNDATVPSFSGFVPLLIDQLSKDTGFSYNYVLYEPTTDYGVAAAHLGILNGSFDMVLFSHADSMSWVGPEGKIENIAYTAPMYQVQHGAVVLKLRQEIGLWRLFDPFTWDLWVAVVVCAFAIALVMVVLHGLSLDNFMGAMTLEYAATAVYHSWTALLGGEDYEWMTPPGKVLRMGLLFLIMILTATYTANLAAILTAPDVIVHGPKSMTQLSFSTACYYVPGNAGDMFKPFAREVITPPMSMMSRRFTLVDGMRWCHEQLKTGRAEVWLGDIPGLNKYMLDNCETDDLAIVPTISVVPSNIVFVLRADHNAFAFNLSSAMSDFSRGHLYQQLVQDSLSLGQSCESLGKQKKAATKISLENMAGLFVVFGSIVGFALLCGLGQRMRSKTQATSFQEGDGHDHNVAAMVTDADMLRSLLEKVGKLENLLEAHPAKTLRLQVAL